VEHGLGQTAGLEDYRGGGGHIANEYWADIYHLARDTYETGELAIGQPWATPIPGSVYTRTGYDYGEEYVVTVSVRFMDAYTGEWTNRTFTVESNEPLAWDEIEDEVRGMTQGQSANAIPDTLMMTRANFYRPVWSD
jgi:hypothetical protein